MHAPDALPSRTPEVSETVSPIADSVFPVFTVIALGAVLKHRGWTDAAFLRSSDRLVYFIFFPAMLFWKIGTPAAEEPGEHAAILPVLGAVLLVYLLSLTCVVVSRVPRYKVGSFSQCCYRFNTYVGMAVVLGVFGEGGVRPFAVLIGTAIPFINVLAVSTLIWFGEQGLASRSKYTLIAKSMVSNPLILSCVAGIVYAQLHWPFPVLMENTFRLMAWVSLPLALLSIGGYLNAAGLKGHVGLALLAALFKLIALPALGFLLLRVFGVTGLAFKVAMTYFALPTSPAGHILSSQLRSDVELASAAIVLSTVLSLASLSVTLYLVAP